MITVGIREMKNRLSEFVRRVRDGEVVLVTDRGIVVAQLTRPGIQIDLVDAASESLEADGLLSSWGEDNRPDLYEGQTPLLSPGTVLELLNAEREDR